MWSKKLKIFSSYKPKAPLPNLFSNYGADLCLNIQSTVMPVHRAKLLDCGMIKNKVEACRKILIIYEDIDINMAYLVISFHYGYDIELSSNLELEKLLKVLQILQAQKLNITVQQLLLHSKQKFQLFYLLQLAYKFRLHKLIQQCLRQLEQQQFQQFNYNKFELLQCDFQLFQVLIRRHHRLKIENKITGVSTQIIKQIIEIYCKRNYFSENIKNRLLQKYVDPWKQRQDQFHYLHLISYKNIKSSYNGNQSDVKSKQQLSITSPSMRDLNSNKKQSRFFNRKYSLQAEKLLEQFSCNSRLKQKFAKSGRLDPKSLMTNQKNYFQPNPPLNNQLGIFYKKLNPSQQYEALKQSIQEINPDMQILQIQKKVNLYTQQIQHSTNQLHKIEMKNTKSMIFEEALEEDIQISVQCAESNAKNANKPISRTEKPYIILN